MANSVQHASPTLASLLELFKDNLMMRLNCHQVGEIVSFDASTQTAEVKIKMLKMRNGVLEDYPILVDCPCIVLGGGEGRITFPIQAGDGCIVMFNDRDIDNWYAGGQTMLPRTERKHSFSDAIALVGIRNLQNKITDYFVNGVELKHSNSSIKLKDGYIDIKGNVNIVQNTVDDNSLHAYVISSYHSGTDWYRVYSDGWCEQGGVVSSSSVTLLKPYKDTNYSIFLGYVGGTDGCWYSTNKTTSSFDQYIKFYGINPMADSAPNYWRACGYIK